MPKTSGHMPLDHHTANNILSRNGLIILATIVLPCLAAEADDWRTIQVPGAWETNLAGIARNYDGFAWYRTWLKPHDSFFTKHERDLFAESVTLTIRDLADAHELFVNGIRIGGGGKFPPNFDSGRSGNHRHKVSPGLLRKGEWNQIAIRSYNQGGPGGFLGEAPFIMDYFNECVLEGVWEFRLGDDRSWLGGALTNKPTASAFDQYHESNRMLGEAAEFVHGEKLSPEESLARFETDEDFKIEQLLAEPLVAQPVHLSFDARGRLWVAQYRQYPYPAGLKPISRDKYYRTHFDKVPPPPPNHDRGRDIISIHEDTDGDGVFDRHKVFLDGLNMANAVLPGRGGVWVMHTPYLLFYPDANGDDMPDGPPLVHLAGFGLEDTHSIANGLVWGMDGWIYGGQGSTTSSRIVRPGIDIAADAWGAHAPRVPVVAPSRRPEASTARAPLAATGAGALPDAIAKPEGVYFEGCMVWRYHPETRAYEIFAEGGGNTFGLEVDAEGRLYSGHNGGTTRGFHFVQGGYYLKQDKDHGKFGPPRNPYSFGELPMLKSAQPIQRFSHFFAVGEGTALPSAFVGQFFSVDPLHSVVIASTRKSLGATFETSDFGTVLTNRDSGFRPVYIANAPDGSLFIADFYEHYIAHGQHYQSQIDPTTGRIYRLRGKNALLEHDIDLSRKSVGELIELLDHPNKWHRQTAVRLLSERKDPSAIPKLRKSLVNGSVVQALHALWALYQIGEVSEPTLLNAVTHRDVAVRLWAVRLVGDYFGSNPLPTARGISPRNAAVKIEGYDVWVPVERPRLPDSISSTLVALAGGDPSPEVRSQIASSARRLQVEHALPIVRTLLTRDEDVTDPYVPLLCWWILELHGSEHRDEVLALFNDKTFWDHPIVFEHILPRLMRRFASEGRRQDFLVCANLLQSAPSPRHATQLMKGFEEAFRGRGMTGLPDELVAALAKAGSSSLMVRLRRGDVTARDEALAVVRDPKAKMEDRLLYTRIVGEVRDTNAIPTLLSLATKENSTGLRTAAMAALGGFDDEGIAARIADAVPTLPNEVRAAAFHLLFTRTTWTKLVLHKLEAGTLSLSSVPREIPDRLRSHSDHSIRELAIKLFSKETSPNPDFNQRLAAVELALRGRAGNPYAGEPVFLERCASCHKLFHKGGSVGPDLTNYQRDNLGTMLVSILNPNAEIREGYTGYELETKDGRSLSGFIADGDAQVVVLRGLDGQDVTLRQSEIQSLQPTGRSLMPEGLLDDLNDQQLRDFFAYLRSSQPMTR